MKKKIKRNKFNISLLGESKVGKTGLSNFFFHKKIDTSYISTIGLESNVATVILEDEEYKFKVFDTAGQERYRSISKSTIKISDGFILVFSVVDEKSFKQIDYWLDSIREETDIHKKVIYLVGNKIDLDKREVSNEDAVNYAKLRQIKYYETSAKTGFAVNQVFNKIFQDIYDLFKEKELNKEGNIELKKEDIKDEISKSKCC